MFLNVAFASNQSPPACTHFSQRSGQRRNSARKNAFSVFFTQFLTAHLTSASVSKCSPRRPSFRGPEVKI